MSVEDVAASWSSGDVWSVPRRQNPWLVSLSLVNGVASSVGDWKFGGEDRKGFGWTTSMSNDIVKQVLNHPPNTKVASHIAAGLQTHII